MRVLTQHTLAFYNVFVPLDQVKRRRNEKTFPSWEELPDGGRRYAYTVQGRSGWKARYVKEVDAEENILKFYQEIYNQRDELVEIHQKYPVDTGHKPVHGARQDR